MARSTRQQEIVDLAWWRRGCRWLWSCQKFIWGTCLFGLFLNLLASWVLTKQFDPKGTPLGLLFQNPLLLLSGAFLLLAQLTIAWVGSHSGTSTIDISLSSDQHNRAGILSALRKAYTEELASSLQGVTRIALGLHERFDLTHPTRLTSWHADRQERAFPDGTSIVDVYDQAGRGLLILGAPGAGKTTLLYDLALALLDRANKDETHPLPVVLNLSSWTQQRGTLREWAVKELELRYLIPRRLGQDWLQRNHFLLLLDGLDEVAIDVRSKCIEAINIYHTEHIQSWVVCTRKDEYTAQPLQLALQSAVIVQPLLLDQVNQYLSHLGRPLAAVREVIRTNTVLQELLTTPLMLSVVMLTYRGKTKKELPHAGGVEEQRNQIFDSYLQQMLYSHEKQYFCSPQQMRQALIWLAHQMQQHSQSIFYLENLQADWLTSRWEQFCYICLGVWFLGIMIGALVTLMVTVMVIVPIVVNINLILIAIGLGGLIGGLLSSKLESVSGRLFFLNRFHQYIIVMIIVLCGIGAGLSNFLFDRLYSDSSLEYALLDGIIWSIGIILLVLLLVFKQNSLEEGTPIRLRLKDRQGGKRRLFRSNYLKFVLFIGLLIGLMIGLSDGLSTGLSTGLRVGVIDGVIDGLSYGLSFGFATFLVCLLLAKQSSTITPTEVLVWSWKKLGSSLFRLNHCKNTFLLGIGTFLYLGLLYGLSYGLSHGLGDGLSEGLSEGLSYGLSIAGSYWLLVGLFQGISSERFSEQQRMIPNQGIRRSFLNGLLMGVLSVSISIVVSGLSTILTTTLFFGLSDGLNLWLSFGLSDGLSFGLSHGLSFGLNLWLSHGLTIGFPAGLLVALLYGWIAWWRHWLLRFLLWREKAISRKYIRLLNEATQRVLLRKSGSGYRFIHDLFRDYLASL